MADPNYCREVSTEIWSASWQEGHLCSRVVQHMEIFHAVWWLQQYNLMEGTLHTDKALHRVNETISVSGELVAQGDLPKLTAKLCKLMTSKVPCRVFASIASAYEQAEIETHVKLSEEKLRMLKTLPWYKKLAKSIDWRQTFHDMKGYIRITSSLKITKFALCVISEADLVILRSLDTNTESDYISALDTVYKKVGQNLVFDGQSMPREITGLRPCLPYSEEAEGKNESKVSRTPCYIL